MQQKMQHYNSQLVFLKPQELQQHQGVEVFNFGKYKGMSVAEVLKKDPGYYSWILNSDFTLNTKAALTKIRLREMSNLITK